MVMYTLYREVTLETVLCTLDVVRVERYKREMDLYRGRHQILSEFVSIRMHELDYCEKYLQAAKKQFWHPVYAFGLERVFPQHDWLTQQKNISDACGRLLSRCPAGLTQWTAVAKRFVFGMEYDHLNRQHKPMCTTVSFS